MLRYSTWFTAIAMTVLVMSLGTAPMAAQVQGSADPAVQNQVTTNNCSTGEPVALNGDMPFQYSVTTDNDGVNHFSISVANNLTGVGQNTGGAYTAGDSNVYNVDSTQSAAEITVEFRSDLSPQNGGPSLTLIQSLDITVDLNGNIRAQITANNTQCGSGS